MYGLCWKKLAFNFARFYSFVLERCIIGELGDFKGVSFFLQDQSTSQIKNCCVWLWGFAPTINVFESRFFAQPAQAQQLTRVMQMLLSNFSFSVPPLNKYANTLLIIT